MLLLLAAAITIHTDFEGGSLGKVTRVAEDHYRLAVEGQSDQDGRNRQASWYYFRVDGAKGRTLTFEMTALAGEYNYRPTKGAITGDTLPFYSTDGVKWKAVEQGEYDAGEPRLTFRLKIEAERVWVAHVAPYTGREYGALERELGRRAWVKVETIGRSVEGRAIPLWTITDGGVADGGKKVVWLMFRQHAWEAGSSWTAEGLLRFAASERPEAARMRREVVLKVLPMCDPDGVAHGGVRFNRHGYDLNRNWDVADSEKMPEIAAQRRAIYEWVDGGKRIDFFLSLHNTETNEYLNGPPDGSGRLAGLLKRVYELWSEGRTFAAAQAPKFMEESTTAGLAGRRNVVQGLWAAKRIAAFEVEMRIARHPKLGRRPGVEDRLLSGEELMVAIWKGVRQAQAD